MLPTISNSTDALIVVLLTVAFLPVMLAATIKVADWLETKIPDGDWW